MAEPGQHNTAALTRAVARGDRDALARFYNAWFDRCFDIARRITGRDESFCLDIVQEAMLRVVKSIRPMRTEEELAAWMWRIVRSAAIDLLRQESRRAARERKAGATVAGIGEASTAGAMEDAAWARAALEGLPAEDRALLAERFGRDRSLNAVGAAAGLTGDAAHGRIRRALARLRALGREVFDER